MKLALYAPTFYPPVIDGTSIQASREAKLLLLNHEVHCLTFSVDRDIRPLNEFYYNDAIERLPAKYIESSPKHRFQFLDGNTMASRIQKINPDVLIVRGWYQHKVIAEVLTKCPKQKILWHVDGLHECHEYFHKETYYQRFISKVSQSQVTFAGLSKFDLPLLTELGFPIYRLCVVPPFLNKSIFQKTKDWSDLCFLSFGRFVPHKEHRFVREQVVRLFPEKQLILAGAADSEQSYGCVQELMQQGASLFLNPTSGIMRTLFIRATHFLSGSMVESLGVSTLEAVAAKCVPLVRDVGGIKTYLPEECIYNSNKMFAEKLKYLCIPEHADAVLKKLKNLRDYLQPESVCRSLNQILEGLL